MDWLRETQWLIWLGAGLVAGLLEVVTLDFFFLMFAGGALAAAASALAGFEFPGQVLVFAAVSVLLLVGVRPPLARWARRSTPHTTTGVEALIGREVETITAVTERAGQVKLAGEIWSARAAPGDPTLEPGSPAYVVRIDGATAVVSATPRTTPPSLPGRGSA